MSEGTTNVGRWAAEAARTGKRLEPTGAEAHPAATVVLLRDSDTGLEVLLTRRASGLAFHGGAWVFPGGRLDPEDWVGAVDADDAARRAAAREAEEEAGLRVAADHLVHLSSWTTPEISPKRFATWFFVGPAPEGDAVADGSETTELSWFRPADALAAHAAGEIDLAPPQYVTLRVLTDFATAAAALDGLADRPVDDFLPRIHFVEGGGVCIYDDDVAYRDDEPDLDRPGRRHRLHMGPGAWRYERD